MQAINRLDANTLRANSGVQHELHERAAAATRRVFGSKVFVRAVVEVSNFCRENCHYCGMRRDNTSLRRYRAQAEQLAELISLHRPASITDVNIQAGEDPVAIRQVALPLIKTLRAQTTLGVSVCLGTLNDGLYRELREAGASIYILKFETASPSLYHRLEAPGNRDERVNHIRALAAAGWRVSSGFICGLPGEGDEELLGNFDLAADLPLAGCSVSPFIPGDETPLAAEAPANLNLTLNCMAALRLMRPDLVIPAVSALNLTGAEGYRRGLGAGANLVTINVTPEAWRGDYLLYKRERFIMTEERVLEAVAAAGLTPSESSLADHYLTGAGGDIATSARPPI
jgi:biotin synthase